LRALHDKDNVMSKPRRWVCYLCLGGFCVCAIVSPFLFDICIVVKDKFIQQLCSSSFLTITKKKKKTKNKKLATKNNK
jgi:hypothetical protein